MSEAIESYENALALVDDTSCESQMTRPVLHMKKGILLLQKFKDSNQGQEMVPESPFRKKKQTLSQIKLKDLKVQQMEQDD